MRQSRFDISIVGLVGRCHIHHIHHLEEFFHVPIGLDFPSFGEPGRAVTVRVIHPLGADAADQLRLRHEPCRNPARPYDAHPLDMAVLLPQHGAGDVLCPLQIYYFTVVFQIVEAARPVGSHGEDVDAQPFDIVELLSLRLLYDDFIREACLLDVLNPGHQRIHYIQLPSGLVVGFRGHPHYQIIPQGFRPFQQAVMPLVKEVECPVRNHLCHTASPSAFLSDDIKSPSPSPLPKHCPQGSRLPMDFPHGTWLSVQTDSRARRTWPVWPLRLLFTAPGSCTGTGAPSPRMSRHCSPRFSHMPGAAFPCGRHFR